MPKGIDSRVTHPLQQGQSHRTVALRPPRRVLSLLGGGRGKRLREYRGGTRQTVSFLSSTSLLASLPQLESILSCQCALAIRTATAIKITFKLIAQSSGVLDETSPRSSSLCGWQFVYLTQSPLGLPPRKFSVERASRLRRKCY